MFFVFVFLLVDYKGFFRLVDYVSVFFRLVGYVRVFFRLVDYVGFFSRLVGCVFFHPCGLCVFQTCDYVSVL